MGRGAGRGDPDHGRHREITAGRQLVAVARSSATWPRTTDHEQGPPSVLLEPGRLRPAIWTGAVGRPLTGGHLLQLSGVARHGSSEHRQERREIPTGPGEQATAPGGPETLAATLVADHSPGYRSRSGALAPSLRIAFALLGSVAAATARTGADARNGAGFRPRTGLVTEPAARLALCADY